MSPRGNDIVWKIIGLIPTRADKNKYKGKIDELVRLNRSARNKSKEK